MMIHKFATLTVADGLLTDLRDTAREQLSEGMRPTRDADTVRFFYLECFSMLHQSIQLMSRIAIKSPSYTWEVRIFL